MIAKTCRRLPPPEQLYNSCNKSATAKKYTHTKGKTTNLFKNASNQLTYYHSSNKQERVFHTGTSKGEEEEKRVTLDRTW